MLKNRVLKNYEIKIVNSKKDYKVKDLKEEIKNWEFKAKRRRKRWIDFISRKPIDFGNYITICRCCVSV